MKLAIILLLSLSSFSCSFRLDAEGNPIFGFNPSEDELRTIIGAFK